MLTGSQLTSLTHSFMPRSKYSGLKKIFVWQQIKTTFRWKEVQSQMYSLPPHFNPQVWAGSSSLHRLGWICTVYPRRTYLLLLTVQRLQYQASCLMFPTCWMLTMWSYICHQQQGFRGNLIWTHSKLHWVANSIRQLKKKYFNCNGEMVTVENIQ